MGTATEAFDFPGDGESEIIFSPGKNDVLFGRGGAINSHEGNITFRQVVNEQKEAYFEASKIEKPKIAIRVVQIIKALSPPGRFLAPVNDTDKNCNKKDSILWYDVGFKKARAKASQCLRERERHEGKLKVSEQSQKVEEPGLSSPTSLTNFYEENQRKRDHASLEVSDSPFHIKAAKNLRMCQSLISTQDNFTPRLQCHYNGFPKHSQILEHSCSDHNQDLRCNHQRNPDQASSCISWIGSFCSLETYLIDTCMSFSSHEPDIEPKDYPYSAEGQIPSYVRSSASMMSDITYQSEYEYMM